MSPPIPKILMVILNVMVKEYNTVPLIQVAYVRRLYAKTFKYNLDIAALENRKPSKMWISSLNISLTLLIDREKNLFWSRPNSGCHAGNDNSFKMNARDQDHLHTSHHICETFHIDIFK